MTATASTRRNPYTTLELHPHMGLLYDGGPNHLPPLSRLSAGRVRLTGTGWAADWGSGSTLTTIGEYADEAAALAAVRGAILAERHCLSAYVAAFDDAVMSSAAAEIEARPLSITQAEEAR